MKNPLDPEKAVRKIKEMLEGLPATQREKVKEAILSSLRSNDKK